MFRKMKLGTLIGTRTWGGLVGTLGFPRLIDGGSVIEGDIIVREPRRKVIVVLSNGGSVIGEIINAEVIERDS